MVRRTLAWLMTLCMLLSLLPMSVFATDAGADDMYVLDAVSNEETQTPAVITAANEDELKAAVADANGKTVMLTADISLSEMVVIPEGTTMTLDLAGHKITVPEATDRHIYALNNKGVLTLADSVGDGSVAARGIYNGYNGSNTEETVAGAKMTIESGKYIAIDTNGGAAIFNCAELVINGGTLEGPVAAVNTRTMGVATINNAAIKSVNNYAIQNNGGKLTINNATVTAGFGAVGCFGGTTVINNGTFLPTGVTATTCHVVYVAGGADVTINGGTYKMDYPADAVPDSGSAVASYYNGTLEINGGTFTSHFDSTSPVELSTGSVIKGGKYLVHNGVASNHSYITNFLAEGYVLSSDGTVKSKTPPNATVSIEDAIILTPETHDYMVWPSGDATIDRPLQIVMNFKANDSFEEAQAGYYGEWICDFYLSFAGLANGSVTADDCYLAGNYGTFGWIVIPTDGLVVETGVQYPVVAAYDANLTYENICDYVKDFTAAIYIAPAVLEANPDFQVTLSLRMTNPENADEYIVVGAPATYTAAQLKAADIKKDTSVVIPNNIVNTIVGGNTNVAETVVSAIVEEIKNSAAMDYTPVNVPEDAELVITLSNMTIAADATVPTKIVYNVAPMKGSAKVEELTEAITFRLPVPAGVDKAYAKVYHETELMGTYAIQGDAVTGKYVEVSSATFSEYAVEPTDESPVTELPDYVVLPEGMDASNYEALFGDDTVTDGTNYYATLQAAVEAIAVAKTVGATLYCKPGADVGSLQHAPVISTLTIYGNGASVTGGAERDFDIGNTDPSGGKDITTDMTLTVKYLNGCGAWGAKATEHTVNLVFENCANMGKVFLTGTTGTLNITMTDCAFEGVIAEAVYSNADGAIQLTRVAFSNLNKAINLNHKAAGKQTVALTDCSFTNCGNNVASDQIPVRVLSSVEGGESVLTVSGCTFTGTPEGGADILLDYGVGTTTATVSGTAADVTVETEANVGTTTTVTAENTTNFTNVVAAKVAEVNGTQYATLAEAIAAAQANDEIVLLADVALTEIVTLPAGVTLNGNGKFIDGEVWASGDLTFEGYTKIKTFNAGYNKPTITIGAGATLETTTGRMVIGHGATFNITGTITDAKTANTADLTPSLIAPGASFTGAGVNFNVTNAYIKFTAYCSSKNNNASSTFKIDVTNSIWEQTGSLVFTEPTDGKDPTFNFNLKDSVLDSTSHLVFAVTKGEIVFDNSNVNVGVYRQLENRSTLTIKNGSVVYAAHATSSNAKNPGTTIVENATYVATGEFSGSDVGTGALIVKSGADVTMGKITGANIQIDATGMAAGDVIDLAADLSAMTGTVEVINNSALEAQIVDGKIVLAEKLVAQIGDVKYATLAAALAAVQEDETIQLLAGVTIEEGTIKLPATLTNVTVKGAVGAIIKNTTIMASDGNSFSYIGLTFEGITFDNSRLVFTGWRNGDEVIKNLTVTGCIVTNLSDDTNKAFLHINKDVSEPVDGLTFTNNVLDGLTGGSKSGIYTVNTGKVTITGNTFNNIVFRPALVQLADCDGVADEIVISDNVFSNTTRLQVYGSEATDGMTPIGTDTLDIAITENVFENISGYYICTWGINGESEISKNYYDSEDLSGKIYWNNINPTTVNGLYDLGVYPVYTELNADGTINTESAFTPELTCVAQVGDVTYTSLAEAVAAVKANGGTLTLLANAYESMTFNYPTDGAPVEITIDLNGFTVTSPESTLWVSDGYVVTVKDSVGTGKIVTTSNNGTSSAEAIAINRDGKVILEGGTVEAPYYGVFLYSGNTIGNEVFVMNGGKIEVPNGGQALSLSTGKATIKGGEVVCNKVPGGAGWNTVVYENGVLEITGGKFFGTIGNWGSISISGGTFSYPDDPNDGFNPEHLADGYFTVENADGSLSVTNDASKLPVDENGFVVVSDYTQLLAALEVDNAKVIMANDITATAAQKTGYGKAGIVLNVGDILDGDGHTLTINGANDLWDCAIAMLGGEVRNLTISGAMRGVFMPGANGDVLIDNCVFEDVVYTFNSDGGSKDYSVTIKNTALNGWTSFSNVHESMTFDTCTFSEGSGYANCVPYQETTFVNCDFDEGFKIHATAAEDNSLKFNNCIYNNEAIDAENALDLFSDGGKVVVNGESIDYTRYAQIVRGEETLVFTSLADAIDAAEAGDTITLLADVTVTEKFNLTGVNLDLNEKTLYLKTTGNYIVDTVTISNGTIDVSGNSVNGNTFFTVGGQWAKAGSVLNLDKVNLVGDGYHTDWAVICVHNGTSLNITDSTVDLKNDNGTGGGFIKDTSGNNNTADVVISNSTITLADVDRGFTGAKVTLDTVDLTITGGEHGINGSELLVKNSTVSISDGTGRGITLNKYNSSIVNSTVTLTNMGEGGIRFKTANALTVDETSTLAPTTAHADVAGATVNGKEVTGTEDEKSTVTVQEAVTTVVNPIKPVAQIGDKQFATLAEAIAAAQAGETITLLADVTVTEKFNLTGVNLDLNENTLYLKTTGNYIVDTVTISNGTIDISGNTLASGTNTVFTVGGQWAKPGSVLNLDKVNLVGDGYHTEWAVICVHNGTSLNITDSTVDLKNDNGTNGGFVKDSSGDNNIANVVISNSTITLANVDRGFTGAKVTLDTVDLTITGGKHGINGSELLVQNSTVSISGGTGRGITLNKYNSSIVNSTVTLTDMGEGGICFKTANALTVDDASTLASTTAHADVAGATVNGKEVTGTEDKMSNVTVADAVTTVVNPIKPVAQIGDKQFATLAEAIAAAQAGDTITLLADVELDAVLEIPADKNIILDLAGNDITVTNGLVNLNIAGTLTMTDSVGSGVSTFRNHYIQAGGELIVDGAILQNVETNTAGYAIYNNGGKLTVIRGVIRSVNTTNYAICLMSGSTATVEGGEIYGRAGISVEGGTLIVNGGEIRSTETARSTSHALWLSSGEVTINGGTFESKTAYNGFAIDVSGGKLTINNGTFIGHDNGETLNNCIYLSGGSTGAVEIKGGNFNYGLEKSSTATGSIAVSGGTFGQTVAKEFCAEGFRPADNGDGTYGVKQKVDFAGTTATLGDSLSLNFFIDVTKLDGEGHVAVVTKTYQDGREPVTVTVEIPQSEWKTHAQYGVYFTFSGIAAKEMTDTFTVTVYNADGIEVTNSFEESLQAYAMRVYNDSTSATLKTLIVDMLNYGASAQVEFEYATHNLANSVLQDEHQAFATTEYVLKNEQSSKENGGYAGSTASLKDEIVLNFVFSNSVKGAYAVATYTDHYGKAETVTVQADGFKAYGKSNFYVPVTGLAIADGYQLVTCKIYDAEGNVITWATDSIASYVYRCINNQGLTSSIYPDILKFITSSAAYFDETK